jgi:hypothetical protein
MKVSKNKEIFYGQYKDTIKKESFKKQGNILWCVPVTVAALGVAWHGMRRDGIAWHVKT